MTTEHKPHQELREALNFIADRLPPMGMTSVPEEPTKPAEANALHDAKRRAYRALTSLEEQLETLQRKLVKTRAEAEEYRELWQEAEGRL
jgi:molecular chaperone GrpE (heat shock protein)